MDKRRKSIVFCGTEAVQLPGVIKDRVSTCEVVRLANTEACKNYLERIHYFADQDNLPLPSVIIVSADCGGDPFSLVARARQLFRTDVLIIYLTPALRASDLQRAYSSGADTFLTQPVIKEDWERLLQIYAPHFACTGL